MRIAKLFNKAVEEVFQIEEENWAIIFKNNIINL
jgi:DNA-binding XRE family transcriptional regulator